MTPDQKLLYVVRTEETKTEAGLEHILEVARILPAELTELKEAEQNRKEARKHYRETQDEYFAQVSSRF